MTGRVAIAPVRRLAGGTDETDQDLVAVELPLLLVLRQPSRGLERSLGVLMRTPGDDRDLVLGLLFAEGLIATARDAVDVRFEDADAAGAARAIVHLDTAIDLEAALAERGLSATSACGLCGRLSVPRVDRRPHDRDACALPASLIASISDRLRAAQPVFDETGGLHAAAVFSAAGELQFVREDVGRHNAVDKVVGGLLQSHALPAIESVLAVSGRVAYEIVQKAGAAGFAAVVAVGAPSSLAIDAARTAGLTLVGFARDGRFNIYTGHNRVRA